MILSIWEEPRMYESYDDKPLPSLEKRSIFKLIEPNIEPESPKYILAWIEFPLRSTRMGGYDDYKPLYMPKNTIFHLSSYNISRSGRHGKALEILLFPANEKVVFKKIRVSNRGNRKEEIVVIDKNGIRSGPRIRVESVIVSNDYAKIVKAYDILNEKDMVMLILDYHVSKKTSAKTIQEIVEGEVELLYSTYSPRKTHWSEYYEVKKPPVVVETTRITNSGNRESYRLEWKGNGK